MKAIIALLEREISDIQFDKKDYYAEGNSTDSYVMSLVGKVEGLKKAIEIIKNN